ncbi:MAG TPA: ABC transporter permease, partial [Acidobacteriota bacterium]|nr:ABC transporter permease [Acidobacteriota bacterium]
MKLPSKIRPAAKRPGLLRKMGAFLHRDVIEAASYKLSFIFSIVGILLSSATFYFISRMIAPGTASLAAYGGDYFSFALIGIAFSGPLGVFQEGLPQVVRSAQVSGTLEALLVTRTPMSVVLFGSSFYPLVFALLRTAVQLALAMAVFGMRMGHVNVPALLVVLVLTSSCFLSLGMLSASFTLVYKLGNPVSWLFGSVSGLLGGMLFPVAVLPPWLRGLSFFLPVTHALEGLRLSLLSSTT